MTADPNRLINIQYGSGNNQPHRIIHPQGSIVNHYTLGGAKLGKMLFDRYDNLTYHEQYYGDLVIKDGQPTRILHGDGTINLNGSSIEYNYHLKDHLGNVRMVITPDGNNEPAVLQANDYYPFGMAYTKNFQSGGGAHQPNKYLYNSKEEQEMPGKWLDYGWRMYDAQLGRWHGVDPLAEQGRRWSPYVYAFNNPIVFVDPDGRWSGHYITSSGQVIGNDGQDDENIHLVASRSDIRSIKRNEKAGGSTDVNSVNISVTTNLTELTESIHVLQRTIDNGGLKEESSVVTPDGEIHRGMTGELAEGGIASANLPFVPGADNTSIHSHPTGITEKGGSFSARRLGPEDKNTFQNFKLNIIVGPLNTAQYDHQSGSLMPRTHGAVFYNRNSKELGSLTRKSIENVLNVFK